MKTLLSVNITEPYLVLTRPNNLNAQNELASGPSISPINLNIKQRKTLRPGKDQFSRCVLIFDVYQLTGAHFRTHSPRLVVAVRRYITLQCLGDDTYIRP